MAPTIFYLISTCFLWEITLSVYVSNLDPNVDCNALLASKAAEREKDPSIMNRTVTSNEIDYKKATSIYDFTLKDSMMEEFSVGDYCRGYVTLIVNLGSQCGLTPKNYEQLTQIYKEYDGKIRMLSFPCNQFMNRMPEGDGEEMLCHLKSKNAAPGGIMAKVNVNGDDAIPLYKYLKDQIQGEAGPDVEWNFTKFLVDKNGKPVKRYPPKFEPNGIIPDIKKLLQN